MDEGLCIARAQAGDRDAFVKLVEAYQTPVYNLTYRMLGSAAEAEDAAQETFLRAWCDLASFKPGRKFASWLLAIAAHYCIDQLRARRATVALDDLSEVLAWPESATLSDEAHDVQTMLQTLSPQARLAITLRYWHDLTYAEIASALDTSEANAKVLVHRARQALAERFVHSQ